ncbi:MAG: M24 family metallopeptidase C-terminal domain-containing protein, partial [Sphaerotilus sp.]|nr:M24 family metallopeptidase C-terminal domain-containing protein [Sphaerotilus sp.]
PGLYRDGRWGIRIENLGMNISVGEPDEFGEYLAFETLTLCPIDTRCIDFGLLRDDERQWLNGYHAEVARRLAPRLSGAALDWLQVRTAPV